jgi:acyl carrier protein
MPPPDIVARLRHQLALHFGGTIESWPDDRTLTSGIDSLAALDFVFAVQKEFGVTITDELAFSSTTVADMIRWLEEHATR